MYPLFLAAACESGADVFGDALGYYDAWLSVFAPNANRCLMVEDGWDRLASSFTGLDSSLMLMEREFEWLTGRYGPNWTTFPLAL